MSLRTSFLIDGFNLYHSVRDIADQNNGVCYKWLDIASLCRALLHKVGNADLQTVYYFSAYAYHLKDPNVVARHKEYVKCLEASGIIKSIAEFHRKKVYCTLFRPNSNTCPNCHGVFWKREEKQTDVAIGCKLLELLINDGNDKTDCVVLITGDTDLVPAIKLGLSLYPSKRILFAFPFLRANAQLKQLCPDSFKLKLKDYANHQFPDPYPMPDGTFVPKPPTW